MQWQMACKLCGAACRLASLEVLELRENLIKSLPDTIARLSRLRSLDLGTNELSTLVRPVPVPVPITSTPPPTTRCPHSTQCLHYVPERNGHRLAHRPCAFLCLCLCLYQLPSSHLGFSSILS